MATIMYCWELGGGLGHVGPFAPIAHRLMEQGHCVVAAVKDLSLFHRSFQQNAPACYEAPRLKPRVKSQGVPTIYADLLLHAGFGENETLLEHVQAWRRMFQHVSPKLILCDHSPGALLAARQCSWRAATIGTGFCIPPDVSPWPMLRPWLGDPPPEALRAEEVLLARLNSVLLQMKQSPLSRVGELYSGVDETFLTTFAELDHFPQRQNAKYWGVWDADLGHPFNWPPGSGPRIAVYVHDFPTLPQLVRILKARRWPSVVYCAELSAERRAELSCETVKFVEQPLRMKQAARECDGTILSGGHGAIATFLLAGKPVVLLPDNVERGLLAKRVMQLNAGEVADASKPDDMGRAVAKLAGCSRISDGLKAFATRYADQSSDDRLEAVVARINELVR